MVAANGGCAWTACSDRVSKVVAAELQNVLRYGERFEFRFRETDTNSATNYGNRGRDGATGTNFGFERSRSNNVLGIRHAMGHDGRLQSDHRTALRKRSRTSSAILRTAI